ncbi:Pyruvate dehydrogenase complex repressor [Vibrio stylophorae]|uniref:Pyruvate dehydrogenase complex repressor n=1 Tax=Vibrio stylophorae TaxID=659351 RepID=A0ABN8DWU1_9VIBR|nr:pyruvate dehydrogenase complex transcriptional repressor PdhR [Vibrio stylophorae]CAH0534431.1 Pyruvate dehydrogenase complex repressor [Vibrio stylophorae]
MSHVPIRAPKLADMIATELERLILEGHFAAGAQLPPERELAKQFDVSRPSLREAILKLEAKGLLSRKQGGGTFVTHTLWPDFSQPLATLMATYPEAPFDLLESRHALESVSAYYAALRGTEEDFEHIQHAQQAIENAQKKGQQEQEASAVVRYLNAVVEATHNVVLLHVVRALSPLLEQNILQNFGLLYRRVEVIEKVSEHRAMVVDAILSRQPEKARDAAHAHLAYLEETLLQLSREELRRERALRRIATTR